MFGASLPTIQIRISAYGSRSALECGGSSHRFPPVPHTGNVQERKRTSALLSCDGDADERLLWIERKSVAAATALEFLHFLGGKITRRGGHPRAGGAAHHAVCSGLFH